MVSYGLGSLTRHQSTQTTQHTSTQNVRDTFSLGHHNASDSTGHIYNTSKDYLSDPLKIQANAQIDIPI